MKIKQQALEAVLGEIYTFKNLFIEQLNEWKAKKEAKVKEWGYSSDDKCK